MAHSRNGGSRAFIRGKLGNDIFSIGKDSKGRKQQVQRAIAESVANPQTTAQMRGRMIMSTVMQAVSAMAAIIDHSFDNVAVGQPNISEFIRRNYALVKADEAAHPASGNEFGLNKYQEKGIKQGAYIVAAGRAAGVANCTINGTAKTITIAVGGTMTFGELKAALSLSAEDYFTPVAIVADKGFVYLRLHLSQSLSDDTVIAAGNIANVFMTDGNVAMTPSVSGTNIVLTFADFSANAGIIVSRKANGGWAHNDVQLAAPSAPAFASNVALPTYPVGAQRFLNGGDTDYVAGSSDVVVDNGGGDNGGGGSTTTKPASPNIAISGDSSPRTVTITAAAGASIYYTTDGSTPTTASTAYTAAFTAADSTVIKAIAVVNGVSSDVASQTVSGGSNGGGNDVN